MKYSRLSILMCVLLLSACSKPSKTDTNLAIEPPSSEVIKVETTESSEVIKVETTESSATNSTKVPKQTLQNEVPKIVSVQSGVDFTQRGSSSSNIAGNLGLMAEYNGWLYVQDVVEEVLFKMLPDGSKKQTVATGEYYNLNILNDWIYYSDGPYEIWKMKLDGSEKIKLSDIRPDGINVIGDFIYYCDYDNYTIRRMKTDGSDDMQLWDSTMLCHIAMYYDDKIYFSVQDGKLYSMNLDGEDEKYITMSGSSYLIVQDWLYVAREDGIYRVNLKDGLEEKLNDIQCNTMNVHKDWIVFQNHSEEVSEFDELYSTSSTFYKMKLDGSDMQKILDRPVWDILTFDDLEGDWIYYYPMYSMDSDINNQILRRVLLDGSIDEPVTIGKIKK